MLLKALLCGLAAYAAELLIEAGFAAAQRYIPGVAPSWVTDNWAQLTSVFYFKLAIKLSIGCAIGFYLEDTAFLARRWWRFCQKRLQRRVCKKALSPFVFKATAASTASTETMPAHATSISLRAGKPAPRVKRTAKRPLPPGQASLLHMGITHLLWVAHAKPASAVTAAAALPRMVQALLQAAAAGKLKYVQFLLAARVNPNGATSNDAATSGWTALRLAAAGGHAQVVQVLLAAGAKVGEEDLEAAVKAGHGQTVAFLAVAAEGLELAKASLVAAARRGDAAAVGLLLRAGVKAHGMGALAAAAAAGSLEAVSALLAAGVPVDELSSAGRTALAAAAEKNHLTVMRHLIAAGANCDTDLFAHRTPLELAASPAAAQLLIDAGARVQEPALNYTALHMHVVKHRADVVALLLQAGADPNVQDQSGVTALHLAASYKLLAAVELLLAAGANANALAGEENEDEEATPLLAAAAAGDPRIIRALLAAGASVHLADAGGRNALMTAAESGNTTVLRVLLAAGANPRGSDNDGWTPLHYALYSCAKASTVRVLLEAGADPNAATYAGDRPWHSAGLVEDGTIIHLLVAAGADLCARNAHGQGPLHVAAGRGRMKTVQNLLAAGAPAGMADKQGRTPLHKAAASSKYDYVQDVQQEHPHAAAIAQLLLAAGAHVDAADSAGETPLLAALQSSHQGVATALLAAGAKPSSQALAAALTSAQQGKLSWGPWMLQLLPSRCPTDAQLHQWIGAAFRNASRREAMFWGVWVLHGQLPADILRLVAAMRCMLG